MIDDEKEKEKEKEEKEKKDKKDEKTGDKKVCIRRLMNFMKLVLPSHFI